MYLELKKQIQSHSGTVEVRQGAEESRSPGS